MEIVSEEYRTETVVVTPQLAEKWICEEVNTANRPLSYTIVRRYADDMRNGRWRFAGDPIRFSKEGKLLDGQHRLWAVVEAEMPAEMVVVLGLDESTQLVMDQGHKRTPGNQLHLVGFQNPNQTAAAVPITRAYKEGLLFRDAKTHHMTATAVTEWAEERRAWIERAQVHFKSVKKARVKPPRVGYAAALIIDEVDPVNARTFFEMLAEGGATRSNPVNQLDRKIRDWADRRNLPPEREVLAFILKAWNMWGAGESTQLKNPNGGWTAANYPVVEPMRVAAWE